MKTGIHSGNVGDIIYAIPLMNALGIERVYLNTEDIHKTIMVNSHCLALKPLLESQGFFVEIVNSKNEKPYDHDLDLFRTSREDLAATHLAIAQARAHKININSSAKFIKGIAAKKVADIVIHRSPRYRNPAFDWTIIKNFASDTVFIGYPAEHENFVNKYKIPVRHFHTKDFLEVARVIAGSKVFIGNQSSPYAIAEGLKHNRILEVDRAIPNCQPQTWNGYPYMWQHDRERAYGMIKYLVENEK